MERSDCKLVAIGREAVERCLACEAVVNREASSDTALAHAALYSLPIET
jgi:hypothetical protein